MGKGFSIMDIMSDISRKEARTDVFEQVSVFDIKPNPKNEYELSEIEKLKDSIYALGGVQQNLVLVRLPENAQYRYLALDGHRRQKACMELVAEGYSEFETVPAVIKGQIETDMEDAVLVMMNSTQRNKTDWEKVMEHMRLKEIIPKIKKRRKLDGRTREIESELLGVSQGQIAIYNTIGSSLIPELTEYLKTGSIGISLAYEAAKLEAGFQEELAELAQNNGSISEEDIKRLSENRPIKGQMRIAEVEQEKNVTDSDTFEEMDPETVRDTAAEKKEICFTDDDNEIAEVVEFIFKLNDFPEDRLTELINTFKQSQNYTQGSIGAQIILDKILPYENGDVRIIYQMGYQVEYIHTRKVFKISICNFWEGFVKAFNIDWKSEEPKQGTTVENEKNVTDSETFELEKHPVTVVWDDKSQSVLRGGYGTMMIDRLIQQYKKYLDLLENNHGLPEQVSKYNCLLDALEMLRSSVTERENIYGEKDG